MNVETLGTFFAVLSLVCAAGTVLTVGLVMAGRLASPASMLSGLQSAMRDSALWLSWLVAATATAGSLYYSLGAGYVPCELCWYQRICIYPLSAMLLVSAVRRDRGVWRYALPLCAVGVVISAYHTQLQAFPDQKSFCSLNNPCTVRYVWEFGFVSLPFMALTAFCFIIALTWIAASSEPITSPGNETEEHDQ